MRSTGGGFFSGGTVPPKDTFTVVLRPGVVWLTEEQRRILYGVRAERNVDESRDGHG